MRGRIGAVAYAIVAAVMAFVIVDCTSMPVSALATDVQLIASGTASLVEAVSTLPSVPADKVAQLQGYLATIQADAQAVAAGTADATGRVQEIAATVRALAPIVLAYVPNGSAWVPVVDAATSLLPTVLAYVGIAGASATAPVYVPNAARLILLGAR